MMRFDVQARCFALLILSLLFGVGACTSTAMPAKPEQTSAIKTLGVTSVVGDKATYKKIGWTVFTNSETTGDISGWNIDQYVVDQIGKKLHSTYSTVAVAMDSVPFKTTNNQPITEVVRSAIRPDQPPVDAYLVLIPTGSPDFIGNSNQWLQGLGVYRRQGYGIQVYAACDLLLIDAHSFALIGGGQLGFDVGGPDMGRILSGKLRSVELAHRKTIPTLSRAETWNDFTPEQLEQIKTAMTALLKDALDYPLKGIGLTH